MLKHKINLTNIGSSENVVLDKPKSKESSPPPPATSVTGTQADRVEQGWHGIQQHKTNRGIDLHMRLFGTGLGNSALGESILNSTEVVEH